LKDDFQMMNCIAIANHALYLLLCTHLHYMLRKNHLVI